MMKPPAHGVVEPLVLVLAISVLATGSLAHADTQQQGRCSQCKSPENGKAICTGRGVCRVQCNDRFVLVEGVCKPGCPPGKQLNRAGRCALCPINTYKATIGAAKCNKCPVGRVTFGLQPANRDAEEDCVPGGLLLPGSSVKGVSLANTLASFEESLDYVPAFTGKGGGRRKGCMINCDGNDTAVGAAEAFLAGSPAAYRSDEPWMGLASRLPQAKAQAPCATVVGSAMSSVLEATLASLQGTPIERVSPLSPTFAYFCSPPTARQCATGWTNYAAAIAVSQHPAEFFATTSCAGAGAQSAATCSSTASKCDPGPVKECVFEALDAFYGIQKAIRRNGAVISGMLIDGTFRTFLDTNPDGIYNSTVDPKAKGALRIAVTLVGYDNLNYHWWVLLPLGTGFGNNGLIKVRYGAAGAGNPEETYAINCRLREGSESQVMTRYLRPDSDQAACYWYTAQQGEFIAGIADTLQLDILQLVSDNAARGVFSFVDNDGKQPDLQKSLAGKELHVCRIHPDLFKHAVTLDCPPGLEADATGSDCIVCPDDTYKPSTAKSCVHCPTGTVTVGSTAADHDEESDCKRAADYLLCDQYIGKTTKSGVYPVTINGTQYQVYCDMETDGGGWMLVMNYNKKAGTAPQTYTRRLQHGFPILNNTGLGFDESRSIGVGGSWGAMDFSVLGALPKLTEFRLFVRNGDGTIHVKSVERNSFQYIRTGRNDPLTSGYVLDWYISPQVGLQLVRMQPEYTPLPGHTSATLSDLVKAPSRNAILAFEKNSLWTDGLMTSERFNTHAQLWLRGSGGVSKDCRPGMFAVGWGCHVCPEGYYKATAGNAACSKCPVGTVTGGEAPMQGRDATAHDSLSDCKIATPAFTLDRPGRGYFDIYTDPLLTAAEAETVCVRAGGHLASITNPSIDKLLSGLFAAPYNLETYWTGGVLLSGNEVWHDLLYYTWLSGAVNEPNFSLYTHFTELATIWGTNQDWPPVVYIVFTAWPTSFPERGHWTAVLPEALLPFVCERYA